MSNEKKSSTEEVLGQLEQIFPKDAEKISTIAFVNWHNLMNHAALEGMDDRQLLFCASLMLALASDNFSFKNKEVESIIDSLKEVSFEQSLDFLKGENEGS
jgi:hypothetical protein